MINPNMTPPPVLRQGLRSKIRAFALLIAATLFSIPLVAILLYVVNVDDTIICNGTVLPENTYDLTPAFDGRVKQIFFRTGDKVKKGDLLVQLDDTEYINSARTIEAAIGILEAQLDVQRSEVEVLKREPLPSEYRHAETRYAAAVETNRKAQEKLETYRNLLKENATSKVEFEKVEKEARESRAELAIREENVRIVREGLAGKIVEKAKNSLVVIQKQIDEKKVQLDLFRQKIRDCKIYAIEDGTILLIPCKRSMFAECGKAAVTLGCNDLMVRAEVDSRFIRKVSLDQEATVSSDVYSRLQYGMFEAKVVKIASVPMDENSDKYPVWLHLKSEGCDIKIGSKAEVRIFTGSSPAIYAFLNITKDDDTAKRLQELRRKNAAENNAKK